MPNKRSLLECRACGNEIKSNHHPYPELCSACRTAAMVIDTMVNPNLAEGRSPSDSSLARMKASMGLRTQALCETAGMAGRMGGMKAQCFGLTAVWTQVVRRAI
jgi:hypothetical protein